MTPEARALSSAPDRPAQVKICGITQVEDARAAIAAGAAMLGVNFYPASPRCIDVERARKIAEAVVGRVKLVGVFVNASVEDILHTARAVPLDVVQLHGDEPLEAAQAIARELPVIRALKVDADFNAARVAPYAFCAGVLLDTPSAGHGGSGRSFAWAGVDWTAIRRMLPKTQLFLAGGLKAENVAEALSHVAPDVVDVCSGVEKEKGVKSVRKMREFVAAVQVAERRER